MQAAVERTRAAVSLTARIRRALSRHGLIGTLRLCLLNVCWVLRDLQPRRRRYRQRQEELDSALGIETRGIVQVEDFETGAVNVIHANAYAPSPPNAVTQLLGDLPIEYENFTFIDLGSGKGLTLFLAGAFPFRKIIGVEFSPVLHRKAQHNLEQYKTRYPGSPEVELVCMDAAEFKFPEQNVVLYMYNPFRGDVMRKVVGNIESFVKTTHKEMYVVYYYPAVEQVFHSVPALKHIAAGSSYRIYHASVQG